MAKIEKPPISETAIKLASFLITPETPQDILLHTFYKCMKKIEQISSVKFSLQQDNEVWDVISKDRIPILKEHYIRELCWTTLTKFTDEEINTMLEECSTFGSIQNKILGFKLFTKKNMSLSSILQKLSNKASSMEGDLYSHIMITLKEKGIHPSDKV